MHNGRENGIVVGTVCDLDDKQKLGRVRVRYPHLGGQRSNWARVASPMAGKGRGFYLIPEKDDEVLVAFEHGDIRRPYIVGALWSTVDRPPVDDGKPVENNLRVLRSRSGHLITLDDTDGAEKVELVDKSGNHRIVIDAANDKLQITCASGDIELTAKGSVTVEAGDAVTVKGKTVSIEATSELKLAGQPVNIN